MDELIIASRAVHFAAVALLFGAPLFRLAIAPKGYGAAAGHASEIVAAIAALVSGLGWFAGVAADMAGSWMDAATPDSLQAVAFDTRFGRLWIARLGCLAALLAIHAFAKRSRGRDIALAIFAGAFAASLVGVGHGLAGSDTIAPIHAVADMLHLLCAAIWIGGLFCLGRLLGKAVTGDDDRDAIRATVSRFSRVGYWAVGLLVISGCVNTLVLLPFPDGLWRTDYGRVLLIKIGFVLVMVAIAAFNRVVLTPKLAADPAGARALWRSVLVEQGVGLLVLAVVAGLGTIEPVP